MPLPVGDIIIPLIVYLNGVQPLKNAITIPTEIPIAEKIAIMKYLKEEDKNRFIKEVDLLNEKNKEDFINLGVYLI